MNNNNFLKNIFSTFFSDISTIFNHDGEFLTPFYSFLFFSGNLFSVIFFSLFPSDSAFDLYSNIAFLVAAFSVAVYFKSKSHGRLFFIAVAFSFFLSFWIVSSSKNDKIIPRVQISIPSGKFIMPNQLLSSHSPGYANS